MSSCETIRLSRDRSRSQSGAWASFAATLRLGFSNNARRQSNNISLARRRSGARRASCRGWKPRQHTERNWLEGGNFKMKPEIRTGLECQRLGRAPQGAKRKEPTPMLAARLLWVLGKKVLPA